MTVAITTAPSLISGPAVTAFALLPVIVTVAVMIWFTRHNSPAEDGPVIGDRTPDENWIWGGIFYWNREDPALIVEKRFGIGYTLNMARPAAWILVSVTLAPLVCRMFWNL
jgi:uncharacterized membrane protein